MEYGCQDLGGRLNRMLLFNGYEESVWKDEEVLEMDGGDSCIMMWMHSMTLNCTLKSS